ncbi:MAG: hypothetical protein LC800_21810, partial [Acidobacteria bacterium]|nr:hypothetical protein [Acidobacteriota bacterium]
MAFVFGVALSLSCLTWAIPRPGGARASGGLRADAAREGRVAQAAGSLRAQLVTQRRDFHMHPELSNREERTARVVAERLKALGLDEVKT